MPLLGRFTSYGALAKGDFAWNIFAGVPKCDVLGIVKDVLLANPFVSPGLLGLAKGEFGPNGFCIDEDTSLGPGEDDDTKLFIGFLGVMWFSEAFVAGCWVDVDVGLVVELVVVAVDDDLANIPGGS